jgi:hypothetical protein
MAMKLLPTHKQANYSNLIKCHPPGIAKPFKRQIGHSSTTQNEVEVCPATTHHCQEFKVSCKGDDDDLRAFKEACDRVGDKALWCVLVLADYPNMKDCRLDNIQNIVARSLNTPTSRLIQFVGEYVFHKCVSIWSAKKDNLGLILIHGRLYKGYAFARMIDDLMHVIQRHGKRNAASMLRRHQFTKRRYALNKSQPTSELATEWALDIVRRISDGVRTYVNRGGNSLLRCCWDNIQLEYFDRKETACIIACKLLDNLAMMKRLTKTTPERKV